MANYSPNSSAHYQAIAANFLRTALTDYVNVVGAQASRDTTTKDTNATASWKAAYSSGASQTNDTTGNFYVSGDYSWRKATLSVRFQLSANPTTTTIYLVTLGGYGVQINTSGNLVLAGTDTGINISTGSFHRLEYIVDKDWRGANKTSFLCRLDGGTAFQLDSATATPFNSLGTYCVRLGDSFSKQTGPNCNVWYNHLSAVFTDDTTRLAPWLNDRTVEQDSRVPIADGTYTDFTIGAGAGSKYQQIDESPSNGLTDYLYGGSDNATQRESATYTAITYSPDTPREYAIFNKFSGGDGKVNNSDFHNLVRDNSVNYELTNNSTNVFAVKTFVPSIIGGLGRPGDNSALSSSILNALEGGVSMIMPVTSSSRVDNTASTKADEGADGATYDGVWQDDTGSSSGTLYTHVNFAKTAGGATFGKALNLNDVQSFTLTWSPTPSNLDTTIGGIKVVSKMESSTHTTQVGMLIGVRISGVDYWTDSSCELKVTNAAEVSSILTWSGSGLNPATGVEWTTAEITSLEWLYKFSTKAGADTLQVDYAYILPLSASKMLYTASFMVVSEGSAPTDNGTVPSTPSTFLPRLTLLGVG